MTSASAFARIHGSTWNSITPTTDLFVRRLNAILYERVYRPIKSEVDPARRALVNEIAFHLFSKATTDNWSSRTPSAEVINEAIRDVQHANEQYYAARAAEIPLSEIETREFLTLYERLRAFIRKAANGKPIELNPHFPGCGILDTSAGDIYFPTTLFEVKAGDRSFRSTDIRQLLLYCALNMMDGKREITHLGLFNPRIGTSFLAPLNELCLDISGRPASDLVSEIIRIVSGGEISR